MKSEQITVNKITADEGMILTDGNTYGKVIFLGEGRSADEFQEITEAEYETILESMSEDIETEVE